MVKREFRLPVFCFLCSFLSPAMQEGAGKEQVLKVVFARGEAEQIITQFHWNIPRAMLLPVEGQSAWEKDNLMCQEYRIEGETLSQGHRGIPFRYAFFPGAATLKEDPVTFVFERYFEADVGEVTLRARLVDCHETVLGERLQVVNIPTNPEMGKPAADATTRLTYPLVTHAIRILPMDRDLKTGEVPVEAVTTGEGIIEVRFLLDRREVGRISKPPFRLVLNLRGGPRKRDLQVAALDEKGRVLARDRTTLNSGPNNFSVRLIEPVESRTYEGGIKAHAVVEVPIQGRLDHLDFYLNDEKAATLYQKPWVTPLRLPEGDGPFYVRAVGFLADGTQTEDLVMFNTPGFIDHVEVHQVELWVSVFDMRGRSVPGLTASDFQVFEDGVSREIRSCAQAGNLPVNLIFLTDISRSMTLSIPSVAKNARKMIRSLIGESDRAALMVFQDHPRILVPFTNDQVYLKAGLTRIPLEAGLSKPRGSGIYDSVTYALHYFGGIKGRRALIVFTDAFDNRSEYGLEEMTHFAKQAGVRIYVVAEPHRNIPRILPDLARETGGEYFVVQRSSLIGSALRRIDEELRTQYLIRFESGAEVRGGDCLSIAVKLRTLEAKIKTRRYYCP